MTTNLFEAVHSSHTENSNLKNTKHPHVQLFFSSMGDRERDRDWDKDAETAAPADEPPPVVREQPNFGLSGLLTAGMNMRHGIEIKYLEPPDAKVPTRRWRLYVFKDGKPQEDPLRLYSKSYFLLGRDRIVVDIPTDHPSCSKQHAVIQFRNVLVENDDGTARRVERPYLMDLGSANGTFLNGDRVESRRYYELRQSDMLRFASSSREYVMVPTDAAAGAAASP
jgi:smad nuclear-interacting protein 1